MNSNNNLVTKVEIFNAKQASKSLGLLDIEQKTNYSSFIQQVSNLTEIKLNTQIILIIQGEYITETYTEKFEFIKETILDLSRKTVVYFIIEELEDITKRINLLQKKGKVQAGFGKYGHYAGCMGDFDASMISVLDSLNWKDEIGKTGLYDQATNQKHNKPNENFSPDFSNKKPITSNEDINLNSKKDNPNSDKIPKYNQPKVNQPDQLQPQTLSQNQLINQDNLLPSDCSENKIKSEVKLLIEGREIQIKPEGILAFNQNHKKLKCFNCHNFLFGAKACKTCSMIFCSKCVANSTKCPDSDCTSNVVEEDISDALRTKLIKVLLECEKECGKDDVSMFNYLEHLEKCEGNFYFIW